MGAPEDMSTAESRAAAVSGDADGGLDSQETDSLAMKALDRWIVELGDDDATLRRQLRSAKRRLKESAK